MPETVHREILGKACSDRRFASARTVLNKLPSRLLEILPDDTTPQLSAVVHRLTGRYLPERRQAPRDLGELMVIAHAVVAAEAGADVIVLIDDGAGQRSAAGEIERLLRLRGAGRTAGTLRLAGTVAVLQRAARTRLVADRGEMRELYQRLRGLDEGLPPIDHTNLLSAEFWSDC
ncbi:hypothetical protein GCM10027445_40210 [Amycolatopsis endophytica]